MQRLAQFVACLKRHEFPSARSFAGTLRAWERRTGERLAVDPRTVKRDVQYLRQELGAPIEYDPINHGYYLLRDDWEFPFWELEGERLFASLFCGHLGQSLVPPVLQPALQQAMQIQLAAWDPEGTVPEVLNTVMMVTQAAPNLCPAVCADVIEAWRQGRLLATDYRRPGEESERRVIETQALFRHAGCWYARAWCREREAWRVFALQRMSATKVLDQTFRRRREVIDELRSGNVFDYDQATGVRLRCLPQDRDFFSERQWFPGQRLEPGPDGSLDLCFDTAPAPLLVHWVLENGGRLVVIEPNALRTLVRSRAAAVVTAHSGHSKKG